MAWSASFLIDPICSENCCSSHTKEKRTHLPLGLWRATHDGNPDGTIPPTSGLEGDGSMLPRISDWPLMTHHVKRHLNTSNRIPTPFLSFGTWELVSSRMHRWKKYGVRNIRLHFLATNQLPESIPVYRATGLVHRMNLDFKSYLTGEYLVHGEVQAQALIFHGSGDGENCILELPATRMATIPGLNCTSVTCTLPQGLFGGARPSSTRLDYPKDNSGAAIYGTKYPIGVWVVWDSITCGKLFTIADWNEYCYGLDSTTLS